MKVYIIIQACTFTSETNVSLYSTKEKAFKKFMDILNTITSDDIYNLEDFMRDNFSATDDGAGWQDDTGKGITEADILDEFKAQAIADLNFCYNGDSDTIEEVTLEEQEITLPELPLTILEIRNGIVKSASDCSRLEIRDYDCYDAGDTLTDDNGDEYIVSDIF